MRVRHKRDRFRVRVRCRRPGATRSPTRPVRRAERFAPEELEAFRRALLRKRREFEDDAASLLSEASAENGKASSTPVHMAELASDTWEQEMTYSLLENRHILLREIDDALQRIEDGTYGVCQANGKNIPKTRLSAIPWVRYCIDCALRQESRSPTRLLRQGTPPW